MQFQQLPRYNFTAPIFQPISPSVYAPPKEGPVITPNTAAASFATPIANAIQGYIEKRPEMAYRKAMMDKAQAQANRENELLEYQKSHLQAETDLAKEHANYWHNGGAANNAWEAATGGIINAASLDETHGIPPGAIPGSLPVSRPGSTNSTRDNGAIDLNRGGDAMGIMPQTSTAPARSPVSFADAGNFTNTAHDFSPAKLDLSGVGAQQPSSMNLSGVAPADMTASSANAGTPAPNARLEPAPYALNLGGNEPKIDLSSSGNLPSIPTSSPNLAQAAPSSAEPTAPEPVQAQAQAQQDGVQKDAIEKWKKLYPGLDDQEAFAVANINQNRTPIAHARNGDVYYDPALKTQYFPQAITRNSDGVLCEERMYPGGYKNLFPLLPSGKIPTKLEEEAVHLDVPTNHKTSDQVAEAIRQKREELGLDLSEYQNGQANTINKDMRSDKNLTDAVKKASELQSVKNSFDTFYRQGDGNGDSGMMDTLIRAFKGSGSVPRPSDQKMLQEADAQRDKWTLDFVTNKYKKGDKFTQPMRDRMNTLMQELYSGNMGVYRNHLNSFRQPYLDKATRLRIPEKHIDNLDVFAEKEPIDIHGSAGAPGQSPQQSTAPGQNPQIDALAAQQFEVLKAQRDAARQRNAQQASAQPTPVQ